MKTARPAPRFSRNSRPKRLCRCREERSTPSPKTAAANGVRLGGEGWAQAKPALTRRFEGGGRLGYGRPRSHGSRFHYDFYLEPLSLHVFPRPLVFQNQGAHSSVHASKLEFLNGGCANARTTGPDPLLREYSHFGLSVQQPCEAAGCNRGKCQHEAFPDTDMYACRVLSVLAHVSSPPKAKRKGGTGFTSGPVTSASNPGPLRQPRFLLPFSSSIAPR